MVTYDYRIGWNGDADFDDVGENVSSRVLANTISMSYGRDQARALSPLAAGEAAFDLNNASRDYSPENTASPLAGRLACGRPVRVTATHLGVDYGLFRGFIDDFNLVPESRSAKFTFTDALDKIRQTSISTVLYQGIRTGDAIHAVLDAVGWPTADRDIDAGGTVIQYWWGEDDAGTEIEKIVNSEGPPALVSVDAAGKFMFRDRHHRLQRSASLTNQVTFRSGTMGALPWFSPPLGYAHGARDVINSVSFQVDVRVAGGELETVWQSSGIISVDDGETVDVTMQASDPFMGAITPEEFVDYQTIVGTVSCSLSRTSGRVATLSVTGVGGPAVIEKIGVRAYSIPVGYTIKVDVEDTASTTKYGEKTWPTDAPWAGPHDALALASLIVGQRAERLPIVTLKLVNFNDTNTTQMLTRDLSDRITVVDSLVGLNTQMFIERISHSIRGAGSQIHETQFGCEKVPAAQGNFIIGTSLLNTGTLRTSGIDDPTTMFVVGTSVLNTGVLVF